MYETLNHSTYTKKKKPHSTHTYRLVVHSFNSCGVFFYEFLCRGAKTTSAYSRYLRSTEYGVQSAALRLLFPSQHPKQHRQKVSGRCVRSTTKHRVLRLRFAFYRRKCSFVRITGTNMYSVLQNTHSSIARHCMYKHSDLWRMNVAIHIQHGIHGWESSIY